jgi:hypothetical protein
MTMNRTAFHSAGGAVRSVFATAIGAVMALAGLVFLLFAVAVGLVAAAALVGWALLRGRRPQGIRFGMPPGARFRGASPWQRPARGEIVDVEAREITSRGPGAL